MSANPDLPIPTVDDWIARRKAIQREAFREFRKGNSIEDCLFRIKVALEEKDIWNFPTTITFATLKTKRSRAAVNTYAILLLKKLKPHLRDAGWHVTNSGVSPIGVFGDQTHVEFLITLCPAEPLPDFDDIGFESETESVTDLVMDPDE